MGTDVPTLQNHETCIISLESHTTGYNAQCIAKVNINLQAITERGLSEPTGEMHAQEPAPQQESIPPVGQSKHQRKHGRDKKAKKPSQVKSSSQPLAPSFIISDISHDPVPALCHPSVAALALERFCSVGYSLLLGISDQVR